MRASSAALATAFLVAAAAVPAGQAPQQPPQTPIFRSNVAVVRVDVSVTGRNDEVVSDLQASDFEIEEDGVRQTVETAQFISLNGTRTTDLNDSLAIRSPEHAEAEAAREDVRVFAIFLDDYHIERMNPEVADRAKRTLRDLLRLFGPNDLIAIMDPVTPLSALRFTRARDELQATIDKFEGRRGQPPAPPRNAAEAEQLGRRNSGEIRAGVTLSALAALVSHLGGLREGRKSVIFVSEGPPVPPGPNERALQEVVQAANRGNVTIHVYDPQPNGFAGRFGRDTLQRLRLQTGGREFFNANGSADELKQIITDASAYYLLGYTPPRTVADGKFHRIEVRVNRNGARVLSRNGYWAPTPEEANPAPAVTLETGVATALSTLVAPTGGRAADVWIGARRGANSLTRLTVSWDPADGTTTPARRPATLTVERLDPATQMPVGEAQSINSAAAAGSSSTATLDIPPGSPLLLRFAALTTAGDVLDRWTQPVTAADLGARPLALSTPRVFRAQSAFEARALATATDHAPSAARRFRQADRVFVDVDVYAGDGQSPAVSAHLLNGKGEQLVELPIPALSNGTARITLPISSLAPSTYVLRVSARAGDQSVQEELAFLVNR